MANETTYIGSPDNPRTPAYVCYITIIGWLIAYYALYKRPNHLALIHFRQALFLHILAFVCNSFLFYLTGSMLIQILVLGALFVLWIIGAMHAINGRKKLIPLIGGVAQSLLATLK